jgi:hypothetical protein
MTLNQLINKTRIKDIDAGMAEVAKFLVIK